MLFVSPPSNNVVADTVVPIAYAVKGEQHYQHLVAYKYRRPVLSAQARLRDLLLLFLRQHWRCFERHSRTPFTHFTIVPSTTGRAGSHPLRSLLGSHLPIPEVAITTDRAYPAGDRSFYPDRFRAWPPDGAASPHVLLVEDAWTTGCRVQSLAHALKAVGATAVTAVVLGRVIDPAWSPSKSLLSQARRGLPFTVDRCCLSDCRHR